MNKEFEDVLDRLRYVIGRAKELQSQAEDRASEMISRAADAEAKLKDYKQRYEDSLIAFDRLNAAKHEVEAELGKSRMALANAEKMNEDTRRKNVALLEQIEELRLNYMERVAMEKDHDAT